MSSAFPRRLNEGVTVQPIGSETLVYDERRHKAYCLNATSATVWNLSDGHRTPAQIAAEATILLTASVSVELVNFTLAELLRDDLLEPATVVAPALPAVSRRAMIQSLGASSALLLPAVAVILAPRAAQAYGGCFDCTTSNVSIQRRIQATGADAAVAAEKLQRQRHNAYKFGDE